MKKFLSISAAALFACSCQQLDQVMNMNKGEPKQEESAQADTGSDPKANYDAKTALKSFVVSNVNGMYVNPAKAEVGSSATRDMGNNQNQSVAVVAKKGDNKIIELTSSFMKDYVSNTPAVVALEVDKNGKVLKAWGGLVGMKAVELEIPKPVATPTPTSSGEKLEVKTKDLGEATIVGVKAVGTETTTKHGSSKVWINKDFPFFSGVMKTEAGASKMIISEYKKSGAKAQLEL